ncbi:uncharacterized protein LOC144678018 [Cetorhinus maximus]
MMSDGGGGLSLPELVQQVALLNWLNSEDDASKQLLKTVTGVRVAHSLFQRLTGQDAIDLYKRQCILGIVAFVKENPRASQSQLNKELEKQVLLFAARVQALQ